MKATIKVEKEVEIKTLQVKAGARYWEDATVNGVEDEEGTLIPCRDGDYWCPVIDVESGIILNWTKGVTADIHYKVCDDGVYTVRGENDEFIFQKDGYVPGTMSPAGKGYGDYIIMHVDENGLIADWKFDIEDFVNEVD